VAGLAPLQGLQAVSGCIDVEAATAEDGKQEGPDRVVVINDENAFLVALRAAFFIDSHGSARAKVHSVKIASLLPFSTLQSFRVRWKVISNRRLEATERND
jgi:hypothetical protein